MDVVVGAGLAGLMAARRLQAAGHDVVVVDKGRAVGGRLATRRITADGVGEARLDHGAQFFTVRGETLGDLVAELTAADLVRVWAHGFGDHDGHPRYVVPTGMTALAKHLARGLDVQVGVELRAIGPGPAGWRLVADDTAYDADAVVLTAPVPQSLALLAAGDTVLDAELAAGLAAIEYDRVLAVLAVLDGAPALPAPGGVQLADGPFTFVADNAAKGVSDVPALTLHTTDAVARARWDDDPDTVLADLLAAAAPWIGTARVAAAQLKRWRYAAPRRTWPDRCCVAATDPGPLVLAGDAFDGPRIEGAVDSGVAAADAVLAASGD
ncbi:MAG TPA: FAD-dependent oxidoreductase [Acidimicrobiales bacterium]|nr:FAD-dependent oxidoreductase [Acidimicrobiales bacterium]